jgi:hypothetical protein
MTATVTQPQSTARTQLSGAAAALNSLASATYVVLGTITHATNDPLESKIEVSVTPGTVTGNKQVVLFAQASIDGTNFETGPTSGTTSTDEPNLRYVGTVPCRTNSTLQRKVMDLSAAYPSGQLPYATKLIAKNDTGAALASSGNDIYSDEYNALIT